MGKVFKTYRFKLMPDKEQEILLAKHFGCVRVVYNHFLNERIEHYQKNNRSDNYNAQALALTQLKKKRIASGLMRSIVKPCRKEHFKRRVETISAGTVDYKGFRIIQSTTVAYPMKPEAHLSL